MKLIGVVDQINQTSMMGWVAITLSEGQSYHEGDFPEVQLLVNGNIKVKTFANLPRTDVNVNHSISFGFSLDISLNELKKISWESLKIIAKNADSLFTELEFWEPLELAIRVHVLDKTVYQKFNNYCKFLQNFDVTTNNFSDFSKNDAQIKNNPLCIITYANAANGWFPYFLEYYKKIVGSQAIYVVTPVPNEFIHMNLGGILTIKNMVYDDSMRANFMSNLATGLQNYYTWTLVCDVDEIVMPDPRLDMDLLEFIKQKSDAVLVSVGLDVVEEATDLKFDFSRTIQEQRGLAIPNSALCKPHIARTAIKYTPGYHYCNHKLELDRSELGLLTLHLKFACSAVRAEVAGIVAITDYADDNIKEYSRMSIQSMQHPAFLTAQRNKLCHLDGPEMMEFKEKYLSNLHEVNGMWFGENFVLPIFISLDDLKVSSN